MASRALVYVRVSSERQVENTSLVEQERVCREWCNARDIVVEKVFVEQGESAKTADRTQFQAMFAHLGRQAKGRITHLVIYKFDRFSRSIDEGAVYRLALRKAGVQLTSISEPTDNSPSGRFLSSIMLAVGELDNDVRAERTVSGMRSRLAAGRWQWPAPTGYLPGSPKGASLVPCPTHGVIVRRLFEMVADGYTKAEALAKATALGLRSTRGNVLTQESVNRLLRNRLYTGTINAPQWKTVIKGDFEPIVSQDLFDQVQMRLDGKSPVAVPHAKDRDDFPLRGFVFCGECLKPVTASVSKGGSGNRHGYYRCHRVKGHINVRADVVEGAFLDLLDRLAPRPERLQILQRVFRHVWSERRLSSESDATALRREITVLTTRKARALEQLTDGVIQPDDYKRLTERTSVSLANLKEQLAAIEAADFDVEAALDYLIHVLWNARTTWEMSNLADRKRLQTRLFPAGLVYDSEGFGTPVTHSIYSLLGDESVLESELASPTGFEPVLPP